MSDVGEDESEDDRDDGEDDQENPAEEASVRSVTVNRVSVAGAGVDLLLHLLLELVRGDAGPHGEEDRQADEAVLDEAGVEVGTGEARQGEDDGPVTQEVGLLCLPGQVQDPGSACLAGDCSR